MSQHKCHCLEPATWFLRLVPTSQVVLKEGDYKSIVLAHSSVATWATCDEHLAEAARKITEQNTTEGGLLVLHREDD